MKKVNSRTIKAYARSLSGLGASIASDLMLLNYKPEYAEAFAQRLKELQEDILIIAKDIAIKEFDVDWEKI